MTGFSIALGVRSVAFDCIVQLSGSGQRMPAEVLQDMMEERASLRRMFLRYAHVMYVQAAATAFVNVEYTVETRLARWLLMCHERVDVRQE